jgi:putative tributyrin esterase
MGGYGSLKFGLKYPDKFVFVSSMSGALPAASWDPAAKDFSTFLKSSIKQVYGPMDSPVRAANNIFKITNALSAAEISKLPYMYMSCGTEDFLIATNREFSDLLLKKKIPHEFRELPGDHSWPFWDNQVQVILQIAAARLSQPATETTPLELK